VYFYVEPDPFELHTFQVTINGSFVCDEFTAHGSAGAAYIGVCGNPVETVTLTCVSGVGFAFGEFGIKCEDVPGACCDEAAGNCTDDVMASACGLRFKAYGTCDELNPPCGEIYGACCYEEECAYERPSLCAGEYQGDGVSCDPNPCLCADFWVYPQGDPPVVLSGTTCGMGNDCELRDTEEVIVAVQISWPGTWTFSLCGSSFDTYWYFGNDCCTQYWSQDDSTECGTAGYLSTYFDPGVYYIDIEGYNGCGNYVLTISGPPEPAPGACCNDLTLACTDGLMPADCFGTYMRHAPGVTCDELSPECGNPGACCDDNAGQCVDDVYELQCTSSRFVAGTLCESIDPLCGEVPIWPCPVDGWVLAPGSFSGSTADAISDCALRTSNDNYVAVYFPSAGTWTIDLCATNPSWDTYLYLGSDCCTSTWYNDDGCPTTGALSIIQAQIDTPGAYIATVEAYSSASGAYVLTVTQAAAADRTAAPAEVAPSKLEQLTPAAR